MSDPAPPSPSRLAAFAQRIGASEWFTAYRADEPTAGRFRARQLQAVTRLTPLAMGANLVNVTLVTAAFWNTPNRNRTLIWAAVLASLLLRSLWSWNRQRRDGRPRETASPRVFRRATFQAALLAAAWAVMPMLLYPESTLREQMIVAIVMAGMMGAGGFMLSTVPVAATAYVIVMALGSALALWRAPIEMPFEIALMLVIYAAIIIGSAWSTARLFGARLLAEAEAEHQNEVIGLLLRDFEEHASDVLWETGPDGRLRQVSPRLSELFGLSAAQISGGHAVELLKSLTPDDDEAHEQLAMLSALLERRVAFRDHVVAVRRGPRTRWWSLSAKPLVDTAGQPAGWRGVSSDVTEARNAHHQLRWLAHNDALTGLANRHQFRQLAAQRLADGGDALAVLCLDLDHFKTVNDSLGHATGDTLLRIVGERLRAATRRSDIVARLGGDEFAVLMHASNPIEIELLSGRLLESLRAPCEVAGLRVDSRASVGVAMAPRDGRDIDTLMNHADLALYAAKAAGRDEVRFFTPQLAHSSRRRVALEQALRQALALGQLRLVFQPVGTFAEWDVVGFEALLRWRHDELGDVSPTEFIPVAEDAGLMPVIGGWVLDEACRHAAAWPLPLPVSVNVSPMQVMVPAFVQRVEDAAMAAGLPLSRLELEITESVLLKESQATGDTLRALHRAGVRMALDDFGTGYSALAYLRRLPLDTLKIDRSFVRELASRSDAREIVKMIVGLARALNMRTVAEGVEEPAHAALLARDGCERMQGWLMSVPLEADAVAPFLRSWPLRRPPVFEVQSPAWARPVGLAR